MSLDWIYDWIFSALPSYGADNILRDRQRATIPAHPFLTYDVVFLDVSGFETSVKDSELYEDPDYEGEPPTPIGTFDRTFQKNCPLQIQIDCYSSTGMVDLQTLVSWSHSDELEKLFNDARVEINSTGAIKNMKFLSDNDYKDRWQVICDCTIALTREEAKNAILNWSIGNTMHGATHEIATTISA